MRMEEGDIRSCNSSFIVPHFIVSSKHRPRIVRAACPRCRRRSSRRASSELVTTSRCTPPARAIDPMPSAVSRVCRSICKAGFALPFDPTMRRAAGRRLLIRTNPRTCYLVLAYQASAPYRRSDASFGR